MSLSQRAVCRMLIDVRSRGAVGDGVADDTSAIQSAINSATSSDDVYFPAATYRINSGVGLRIPSRRTLLLDEAELVAVNVAPRARFIMTEPGADGVRIYRGRIRGSRDSVPGLQWGIGIYLDAATDVIIEETDVVGCFTDSFHLGGNRPCESIDLRSVMASESRRCGIAITHARSVFIQSAMIASCGGQDGQDPKTGIDIEPNANESVYNVSVIDCTIDQNDVGIYAQRGLGQYCSRVRVLDCRIGSNVRYGLIGSAVETLTIMGCDITASMWGASIGNGTTVLTYADNRVSQCAHPLVLAGVEHPKIYNNAFEGRMEILPVVGRPGVYGRVYMEVG